MEKFKLIIAGGRDFNNYEMLARKVDCVLAQKIKNYQIEIITGKAPGADALGERYAAKKNFTLKAFPAPPPTDINAAVQRDKQIGLYADACICFWDGQSQGTKRMIDTACQYHLLLRICTYIRVPAP